MTNDQAVPRTLEVARAKMLNESRTRQKKSRFSPLPLVLLLVFVAMVLVLRISVDERAYG
jgi:predicted nucleic acid-binding Zn ribbon protein